MEYQQCGECGFVWKKTSVENNGGYCRECDANDWTDVSLDEYMNSNNRIAAKLGV